MATFVVDGSNERGNDVSFDGGVVTFHRYMCGGKVSNVIDQA
jgi:hypothetical protein